tara:strand:- start:862 stop:1467 length:606 start_codon:yes stop_codon:yes gene_type:complete
MINFENINFLLLIVIIYLLYYYTKIPKYLNDYILEIPEPPSSNNITNVHESHIKFEDFKIYQKLNSISYAHAEKYWKRYQKFKNKAERLNKYKEHIYFDNAVLGFQKCINFLQSIGTSTKEKKIKTGYETDNFKRKSEIIEISSKTKKLYIQEMIILNDLAKKINENWKKNKNVYNRPVEFNINYPRENADDTLNYFDYYV